MDRNEIRTIEMVRAIRDQLHEETKQLTAEELEAFIAREAAWVTHGAAPGENTSGQSAA